MRPPLCPLLIVYALIQVTAAIKCFCDRVSCEDNLVCHAQYCIIGLAKDAGDTKENKLRQLCGAGELAHSHLDRCNQRDAQWQEVCYCDDEYCNTFAFLRSSMDAHSAAHAMIAEPASHNAYSNLFDSPYPLTPRKDGSGHHHQRSSLIVLLVIIPLSVGALAVCLIFLNYHCKMC